MRIGLVPADDLAEEKLLAAEMLLKRAPCFHQGMLARLILGSIPDPLQNHRVQAGGKDSAVVIGKPPKVHLVGLQAHWHVLDKVHFGWFTNYHVPI